MWNVIFILVSYNMWATRFVKSCFISRNVIKKDALLSSSSSSSSLRLNKLISCSHFISLFRFIRMLLFFIFSGTLYIIIQVDIYFISRNAILNWDLLTLVPLLSNRTVVLVLYSVIMCYRSGVNIGGSLVSFALNLARIYWVSKAMLRGLPPAVSQCTTFHV